MITSNTNVGFTREIHMKLKRLNLDEANPHLKGKPVTGGNYQLGIYNEIADVETSRSLYKDLESFISLYDERGSSYTSFVAVFAKPSHILDGQFSKLLWNQLFILQQLNKRPFEIQKEVKINPDHESYSFNLLSKDFSALGMHSKSARQARRFDYPLMVFYPKRREIIWKLPNN